MYLHINWMSLLSWTKQARFPVRLDTMAQRPTCRVVFSPKLKRKKGPMLGAAFAGQTFYGVIAADRID